ncbi:FtsX-like permease family protein [Chitinophaga agrisoli]|uniref:FtsX-like permease family protein n=1 Tax=Chitinophaga agrisoli TaxID=2607653 RepID=A0A5B2VL28_9BACT|nr:ABC transporter permease [Chitinophaga agrisoli]KAA2239330.1 FtsX-like permease family protein [Chitinophaga agrisoli]
MLRNYFKIAIRQLRKQKMYAAVKIGGFALSIAACVLIGLYVKNELSYDRSYPNADRIYRVIGMSDDNGYVQRGASFPPPMARALKADFAEVEVAGRLMPNRLFDGAGSNQLRRADDVANTYEEGFTYADPELMDLLQLPMAYGNSHALDEPNTIVISKRKADKYFPHENPIGKLLILNDNINKPYRIGGVMENIPANSHLERFDFLLTLKGKELWPGEQPSWMSSNYHNYVRLRAGTDIARLQQKMTEVILNKYYIPTMRAAGFKDVERLGKTLKLDVLLQPVGDIHLRSYNMDGDSESGDIRFVWLFSAIACFILIIACINFINLSTARSANRAKEVGLKKTIGADRSSLIQQFIAESLVFSFLSILLGCLLAWVLLPYFNMLAGRSLVFPWREWWLLPVLAAAAVFLGTLAGLYPAVYLSSFQPVKVLKGSVSRGVKNSNLRSILVVFQFTTSVILIIGTVVIYRQMQFLLHRKLGFDKEQVVMIQGANSLGKQATAFKDELLKLPGVQHVAVSDFLPVSGTKRNGNQFWKAGRMRDDNPADGQFWTVDHDYITTMGMHMAAGRNFSKDMSTDSAAAILNQTLAGKLFPNGEDPLGKRITNSNGIYTVIGVVSDFNFESMRTRIDGLCMTLGNSPSIISVKAHTADMQQLLTALTGVWKNFTPNQPFRYSFLDERFAEMYADVERTGRIFTTFAILAIVVACLGLFALSAFMAEQRSKEISIRKVLGASVTQVTTLISRDFLKLVLIAVLLGSPIAWWGMRLWLQDFAYQTTISWWIFVVAGMSAISIALLTISFQSIKAAIADPVRSLKSE